MAAINLALVSTAFDFPGYRTLRTYGANEIAPGVTEVLAYGTAVHVQKSEG